MVVVMAVTLYILGVGFLAGSWMLSLFLDENRYDLMRGEYVGGFAVVVLFIVGGLMFLCFGTEVAFST